MFLHNPLHWLTSNESWLRPLLDVHNGLETLLWLQQRTLSESQRWSWLLDQWDQRCHLACPPGCSKASISQAVLYPRIACVLTGETDKGSYTYQSIATFLKTILIRTKNNLHVHWHKLVKQIKFFHRTNVSIYESYFVRPSTELKNKTKECTIFFSLGLKCIQYSSFTSRQYTVTLKKYQERILFIRKIHEVKWNKHRKID